MPRPIWSGSISFGLVSIPISLMTAKEDHRISFHMLDKKDYGRIGYKTINKATGREVSRDRIVKGYEYESGQFVVMTDQDFERANPKKTRTIDIEDFVQLEEVDPVLFEQPYYLVPGNGGEKGYLLLKQVMEETGKIAIGTFVMREKQKLVAILARGDFLMLETLRYAHEVITANEAKAIHNKIAKTKISKKELEMAESLVRGMTAKWNPEKYKDTYYDDVMRLIKAKVKGGKAVEAFETEEADSTPKTKVLDLMPLLKQSLEKKKGRGSHGAAHV
jgi:DNA end-binding protein Ku